jgi:hypothetical protein
VVALIIFLKYCVVDYNGTVLKHKNETVKRSLISYTFNLSKACKKIYKLEK